MKQFFVNIYNKWDGELFGVHHVFTDGLRFFHQSANTYGLLKEFSTKNYHNYPDFLKYTNYVNVERYWLDFNIAFNDVMSDSVLD